LQRLLAYVLLAVIAACGLFFVDGAIAVALLSGVATAFAVPAIDAGVTNARYLRLLLTSLRSFRREIRVSVSYLYRIEHQGRFLLVQGNRLPDQYQPVGGVYKFNESARALLQDWGARTDDLIPIDEVSADDLRLRLPARKLVDFVRWFESERSREVGPWREFYEELLRTGILPADEFPHVRADFVRRHFDPVHYSPFSQCQELLIADIYALVPNNTQRAILRTLADADGIGRGFLWAEADLIQRRGAAPGKPHSRAIAVTAGWTIT